MEKCVLDESENKTKSICASFNSKNLEKIKISNCGYESDTMVNYDYSLKPKELIYSCLKSRPELSFHKKDLNIEKNSEEIFLKDNIDCIKQILLIVDNTNKDTDKNNLKTKNVCATINYIYKKLLMNNYKISPDNLENYIKFCITHKFLERSVTDDWVYRIGPNALKKGLINEKKNIKKKSKESYSLISSNNLKLSNLKKEFVDLKEELISLRRGYSLLKQKYEKLERQNEIFSKKFEKFNKF